MAYLHIYQLTYNVVYLVTMVVFRILLGSFRIFANHIVFNFVCRSVDTHSSPSLSIKSTYGQILSGVFSKQPLWVLRLL